MRLALEPSVPIRSGFQNPFVLRYGLWNGMPFLRRTATNGLQHVRAGREEHHRLALLQVLLGALEDEILGRLVSATREPLYAPSSARGR